MIKFFRNIRRKLAAENKVASYLRYAIGEILLVVIGILIALQINNWNENRKSQNMADEVYNNLLTSLEQDSVEVQRTIDLLTKSLETQKKLILNQLDQQIKELNQNDLEKIVGNISYAVMSFFPKSGVYSLITSNNSMELLQSKKIKTLLINLYDFQYKRYENVDVIIDNKYHYQLGTLIRTKIGFIGEYDSASEFTVVKHVDPNLFNEHYKELVTECQDIYGILSTGKNYLVQIRISINELLQLIRKELEK